MFEVIVKTENEIAKKLLIDNIKIDTSYTEDMQDGQVIEEVKIINLFC